MTVTIFNYLCFLVLSFKSIHGAVDDICDYIETCVNDPCGCSEDSNCLTCSGGQGCSDCRPNYFLADNNEKCMSCDLLDGCLDCNKEYGCSSMGCDATRNCVRKKSSLCNIWVCDGCDPLPTNSPTNEPSNDPTNDPSNNPSDRPSMTPSSEPTNEPSASPTKLEDYYAGLTNELFGGIGNGDFSEFYDENTIILIEGYGQADGATFEKLFGICDVSADTTVHFFDMAEVTNTINIEYYVHCHSTQFGVFFIHAMEHFYFVNEVLAYDAVHWLDPTPVDYILTVLNS